MKLVEEESVKIGLRREDALGQSKLRVSINQIAAEVNLANLTCWVYFQILNIGVFLSMLVLRSLHNL